MLPRFMDVDLTDKELAIILATLPRGLSEELSQGPWPEPGCGVCQAVEKLESALRPEQQFIAGCLVEWHDEPMRDSALSRIEGSRETYYRCLAIYKGATLLLEKT